MKRAQLRQQLAALTALHSMDRAKLEAVMLDLADAETLLAEKAQRLAEISAQRDAIDAEQRKAIADGAYIAVESVSLLSRQYLLAYELTQRAQVTQTAAREARDACKVEVAKHQSRVEQLEDSVDTTKRLLIKEQERVAGIMLDDMWLARMQFQEATP